MGLLWYRFRTKAVVSIPFPDRVRYRLQRQWHNTVTRQSQLYHCRYTQSQVYEEPFVGIVTYDTVSRQRQLCQYLYQTEAIVLIPFPDKDNCINTVTTQRQLYRQLYEDLCVGLLWYRFRTKAVVSIPLPDRGSYRRNPLWVFSDTVSRHRQLYQYSYQTQRQIIQANSLCESCATSFPDKGKNVVSRQKQK